MTAPLVLHASAVAVAGRALLIRGASGAGKSALALEMMGLGARLVADDRVIVTRDTDGLSLSAPEPIRGLIEARGLGLLRAEVSGQARLVAVIDLDVAETERLPPFRTTAILGVDVPLLHNAARAYFAAALVQYLRGGRSA
jgi:HPr kinase/phosphorylase